MSLVALGTAMGLTAVAVGDFGSRNGWAYSTASVFFWFGLIALFVPTAVRVLMRNVSAQERLALLVLLASALYVVKVLGSPGAFTFNDEYTALRDTEEILRTHHLFSYNPILTTSPYYPGLTALTAGLVDLTGLSPFVSGLIIIGVARVLLVACLFAVGGRVTRSDRAAALVVLIYIVNPRFLFFSSTFSYESLALPLCAFVVWWMGRTRDSRGGTALAAAAVTATAVVITHHVAALALASLLTAWWLAERRVSVSTAGRRNIAIMAGFTMAGAVAWLFVVASPAASYLFSQNVWPALKSAASVVMNETPRRQLYTSYGLASPLWESMFGYAATALLLVTLPFALVRAWTAGRRRPAVLVAAAVAVLFPLSLIPLLAPEGVAISGRSSEYVFAGLGCVFGLLLISDAHRAASRDWRTDSITGFLTRLRTAVAGHSTGVAAVLVSIVFIGEVTVGTAFYQRMPESSRPTGYPWMVQPDVLAASEWAKANLGIHQQFGASALDSFALASAGLQNPVPHERIWPVFFAPEINPEVTQIIKSTGVRYLLLDWRMTQGVPATPGFYFDPNEPGAGQYKSVFPTVGLSKFVATSCAHVIYDTGAIQIVDVSQIEDGSCTA